MRSKRGTVVDASIDMQYQLMHMTVYCIIPRGVCNTFRCNRKPLFSYLGSLHLESHTTRYHCGNIQVTGQRLGIYKNQSVKGKKTEACDPLS